MVDSIDLLGHGRTVDAGLDAFFTPASIAIVGASGRSESPYARPLTYLTEIGYPGTIHLVNPRYDQIAGRPCHRDLASVPGDIDLVMIMVAADRTTTLLREAAQKGCRAAIVCSSGFSETGPAGAALQREVEAVARESGIRVLGPNSQGLFHAASRVAATFTGAAALGLPRSGAVAYIGQSGAVGGVVLDLAREAGLPLGAWISTGNAIDVTAMDAALELIEDPSIRVLMLYLETLPDYAAYAQLARRTAALGKRVLVLRSGTSDAGRRAVASHTGAMVASDEAFRLVSRRFGVIQVDDVDALVWAAQLVADGTRFGRRVGIVTTSGGAGSLAADTCTRLGLVVEDLDASTQEALREVVPEYGAVANPVDVTVQLLTRDDSSFGDVCQRVLDSDAIDTLLILATSPMGDLGVRLAEQIIELARSSKKPILPVWMAGREQTRESRSMFVRSGVLAFDSLTRALALAAVLCDDPDRAVSERAIARPAMSTDGLGPVVIEAEAAALLDAFGIPRPRSVLVHNAEQARRAVVEIGGSAVLKVQSRKILHKTEVAGVRTGVTAETAAAVHDDLAQLLTGDPEDGGVLVQEQLSAHAELIVGITRANPDYPPVLTVGFGGVATELYADIASDVLPVDEESVERLLRSLKAAPLLTGFRGRPSLDITAAVDAINRIGQLGEAWGSALTELEINPLVVSEAGAWAVDFMAHQSVEEVSHG